MKIKILVFLLFLILFVNVPISYAEKYLSNFNNGRTDGWWLGYSLHTPTVLGNWRVENKMLLQDQSGDEFIALKEEPQISDQTIEVKAKINDPGGYGGVLVWFKDDYNWVGIRLYPAAKEIWISEVVNNSWDLFRYSYGANNNTWYNLKVNTNSNDGFLDIYVDDVYLFTHNVTTQNRIGKSGLFNGNAGGAFDSFVISTAQNSNKFNK